MTERVLSELLEIDVDVCTNLYGESPCTAGRRFTPILDLDFTGRAPSLTPVTGTATVTFTRTGATATRVNESGIIADVAADVARFDYDPFTLRSKGLLVEEARTNLCLQSQDLATTWTVTAATIQVNVATAPDGTVTADKIRETSATSDHRATQAFTKAASAIQYCISTHLQAAERTWAVIIATDGTNGAQQWVNLTNGELGTRNTFGTGWTQQDGEITAYPNGVYRVGLIFTTDTGTTLQFRILPTTADNISSYAGTTDWGIYAWGHQLEAGAHMSSYIRTTTASVVRNADAPLCSSIGGFFNAAEGTIYVEGIAGGLTGVSGNKYFCAFSDGGNNELIGQYITLASPGLVVIDGGVQQANITRTATTQGTTVRNLMRYKVNDFAIAASTQLTVGTDTVGTLPTVDRLHLGGDGSGNQKFNGHLRRWVYWNTARVDADLLTLATSTLIDLANACYNTWRTCVDKVNYVKGTQTLRFTGSGSPLNTSLPARPTITSIATAPTEIDPEKGLATRASSTITLVDAPDSDVGLDQYIRDRAVVAGGTFWSRFMARNQNYSGRQARVKRAFVNAGVFGTYTTERYIVDAIRGPDGTGNMQVQLKDPVKLADRSTAPATSSGKLAIELLAGDLQMTLGSGQGAEYTSTGYVRIGDEVIRYTGNTADVLSWPTTAFRTQFNTASSTGDVGDSVQQCLVYENAGFATVIENLLNLAGILDADIDLAGLASEVDTWLGTDYNVTTCISDPEDISTLLGELLMQSNSVIWWSPTEQKVKFKVYAPASPASVVSVTLDDEAELIADSVALTRMDEERITMASINFGLTSATANIEETKNYRLAEVAIDADAESVNEYNDRRPKILFSRWFTATNTVAMRGLVARYVGRYRDAPEKIDFALDPKDGSIKEGDVVDVQTYRLVDFSGSIRTARVLITKRSDRGMDVQYGARITNFDRPYGFIAPNGTADYPGNFGYACVTGITGLMTDGSQGYLII